MKTSKKPPPVASSGSAALRQGNARNETAASYCMIDPNRSGTRRASFAPRVVATAAKMDLYRERRNNQACAQLQPADKDEPVPGETEQERKRRMNRINARRKRARRVLRVEHLTEQYHDLKEARETLENQNKTLRSSIAIVKQYMQTNATATEASQASLLAHALSETKEPPRKASPVANGSVGGLTPFSTPNVPASAPTPAASGVNQMHMLLPGRSSVTQTGAWQPALGMDNVTQLHVRNCDNETTPLGPAEGSLPRDFGSSAFAGPPASQPEANQDPDVFSALANVLIQMVCQGNPTSGAEHQKHNASPTSQSLEAQVLQQYGSAVNSKMNGLSSVANAPTPSLSPNGFSADSSAPSPNHKPQSSPNPDTEIMSILSSPSFVALLGHLSGLPAKPSVPNTNLDSWNQLVVTLLNPSSAKTEGKGDVPFRGGFQTAQRNDNFGATTTAGMPNAQTEPCAGTHRESSPSSNGMMGTHHSPTPLQVGQAPSLNPSLSEIIINAATKNPEVLMEALKLLSSSAASSSPSHISISS